jgi:hypothetical protein
MMKPLCERMPQTAAEPGSEMISSLLMPYRLSVFPKAFLALLRAVDPVVPDTLSLVFIDEPVLVPLIPVVEPPLVVCASANVLESAIVVSFVVVLLVA